MCENCCFCYLAPNFKATNKKTFDEFQLENHQSYYAFSYMKNFKNISVKIFQDKSIKVANMLL